MLDEIGTLGLDEQAMLLCALEEKRYKPVGSDTDVESDFQIIAGTNCDLRQAVVAGTFRADLLARLNLWTVTLPGLADRVEDIEPNLDFELARAAKVLGHQVWMTQAARSAYLQFACRYSWPGNFRDLASSVMRMATLAEKGCIEKQDVLDETTLMLTEGEKVSACPAPVTLAPTMQDMVLCQAVLHDTAAQHDIFELAQLEVALRAISTTDSMAQAGRLLFEVSRASKQSPNDSDRISKLLARFHLNYTKTKAVLRMKAEPAEQQA
jgi:transcriptional regulatory protein RtcR